MSKLAKEIRAIVSRPQELKINLPALDYTKITEDYSTTPTYSLKYRIGVEFSAQVYITEGESAEHKSHVVNQVRRAIVEEVFGEFRPIINKLRISIISRDHTEAASLLEELHRQMFTDGT